MTTQGIFLDAREVTELEAIRDACGEVVTTPQEWRACFLLSTRAEQLATAEGVIATYWRGVDLEDEVRRQRVAALDAHRRIGELEARVESLEGDVTELEADLGHLAECAGAA